MSAHTPGPWKVFTAKGASHRIIGIGEVTGEGITDCGFGVWRGGSDEALANARLIAAAPDLLDAILKSDDAHWTTAMRAAIAKATGDA